MEARIRKWGNSLALRIPQSLARQIALKPGAPVRPGLHGSNLTISPIRPPGVRPDDLLAQVTDTNRHGEVDTGAARGGEAWWVRRGGTRTRATRTRVNLVRRSGLVHD